MSKKFLSPIKLAQGATNPATGSTGELFYNTTDLKVYSHNGTTWLPSAGGFTISDTAPISPTPRHGDSWLDSSDGSLYARYVDQDGTGQWIQIQTNSVINTALATRMSAAENSITTLQTNDTGQASSISTLQGQMTTANSNITSLQSRATVLEAKNMSYNYVLNGAFDIWQRGTSVPHAGGGVGADMWREYTDSGSGTQSRDTTDYPTGVVGQSYKFTAGANSTNWSIFQLIETLTASLLAGKTVTLSMYLKSDVARTLRMTLSYSTTTDAAWTTTFTTLATTDCSTTSTWTRFSITTSIPSTAKTLNLSIGTVGASIASAGTVNVAAVQLEEGSAATPFRRNAPSIQAELASCQRHYLRLTGNTNGTLGTGLFYASTGAYAHVTFPVTMRATPSGVDAWSGLYFTDRTNVDATVSALPVGTIIYMSPNSAHFGMTTAAGGTVNRPGFLCFSGTSSYLAFSAEL